MTAVHPTDQRTQSAEGIARIVVATDGSFESDHALHTAALLARPTGASIEIVSVCDTIANGEINPSMFPPIELLEEMSDTRDRRLRIVRDQVTRLFGAPDAYHAAVRFGAISHEIAKFSRDVGADLIMTGRGRHGVLDRLLGEEHLVRLLRLTPCPVLAVEPIAREVPRTIVMGLDFSERDKEVLAATAALAPTDARIYLVHVKPETVLGVPVSASAWIADYDARLRTAMENTRRWNALAAYPNVETLLLTGHPGLELTGFARRVNADLVAVGIHGAGFVHRTIIGSATTYLLRSVETSLLAVPPTLTHLPTPIL